MLYEDDYEFEEQPANIRDRQIPGKTTGERTSTGTGERTGGGGGRRGGSGGGGRRGGGGYGGGGGRGGYHHTPKEKSTLEFPDDAKPARDLLASILNQMGMEHVDIGYIPRKEGEYLEVTGPDLAMLIGRHGNTLEALNLIFNNIINAGVRNNRRYYTIDAEGYRARRADQLKRARGRDRRARAARRQAAQARTDAAFGAQDRPSRDCRQSRSFEPNRRAKSPNAAWSFTRRRCRTSARSTRYGCGSC